MANAFEDGLSSTEKVLDTQTIEGTRVREELTPDQTIRLATLHEANREEEFGPDRAKYVMETAYRYEKYVRSGYEAAEDLFYNEQTDVKIRAALAESGVQGRPFADTIIRTLTEAGILFRERVPSITFGDDDV